MGRTISEEKGEEKQYKDQNTTSPDTYSPLNDLIRIRQDIGLINEYNILIRDESTSRIHIEQERRSLATKLYGARLPLALTRTSETPVEMYIREQAATKRWAEYDSKKGRKQLTLSGYRRRLNELRGSKALQSRRKGRGRYVRTEDIDKVIKNWPQRT